MKYVYWCQDDTSQANTRFYFSTKANVTQKGLGFGFTVCYSIIKKHDGHIDVESEPGKGTAVILYLPAVDDPLCSQNATSFAAKY